jgi:hypothetical protein
MHTILFLEPTQSQNTIALAHLFVADGIGNPVVIFKIGSGSKMIVWGHDIYGLTEPKIMVTISSYQTGFVETTCREEHLDLPLLLG